MTLKDLIKNNFVHFQFLRQGFAYYNVFIHEGETMDIDTPNGKKTLPISSQYQFTIPLNDIGNGTLNHRMKAIECMRWIRKALESKELVKI